MVHGDQGAVVALDHTDCQYEALKYLGQRHLVDQMVVNVQEGGLVRLTDLAP